jgi:hypothetical protein
VAYLMLLSNEISAQIQDLPVGDLWLFLPVGYLLTILIEAPILLLGLSGKLTVRQRLLCGVWLTACTYPIVVLVLPTLFYGSLRWQYLAVAETFAPAAECLIFWLAFRGRGILETFDWLRCIAAIILANLASFGAGEVLNYFSWFAIL